MKKRKRNGLKRALIGVLLILSLFLCINMNAAAQAIKPFKLTYAMGSVGGAGHAISEAVGEALRRYAPGSRITIMPGDMAGNNMAVHSHEVDIGLTFGPSLVSAYMGMEPFKSPLKDLRAILALYPQYFSPNGTKKAGISSFEDIKNKKAPVTIAVNRKNTMQEILTREILLEYGISYDDIASWGGKVYFMAGGEARELLKDGHIQFMLGSFAAIPEPRLVEAAVFQPMMILEVKKSIREKLGKKYGLREGTIPKGAYNFLDKDIHTLEMWLLLFCNETLPADVVYEFTKCIDKSRPYLSRVHSVIKDLKPETMADIKGVPLHEGAKRYYREIGIKIP